MKPVVNLIVLGKGNVGSAWLSLFLQLKQFNQKDVDLRLVALANSRVCLFAANGLTQAAIDDFSAQASQYEITDLFEQVKQHQLSNLVLVDLTASEKVANSYLEFALQGWHIVSANKLPLTVSRERYQRLVETLTTNKCYWGINATVGAALPVQASVLELLQAGDKLQKIEGVFSGSLSYLLNNYDGEQSFTELVKQALELGYTEPDPREDLSGKDVQRKLLILARLAGQNLGLSDIKVSALLPEHLLQGSLADFWQNQEAIDSHMAELYRQAKSKDERLVYAAQGQFFGPVTEASVSLQAKPSDSALVQLTPTDNVFSLTTDFYTDNPLVIRGPGAGAVITATAVNIDINKFITQCAIAAERYQ